MDILNAKEEFRNFFILLSKDNWFNKISNCRQLEKINSTTFKADNDLWNYSIQRLEFKNICLERHTRPLIVNKKVKDGYGSSKLLLSIDCTLNIHSDLRTIVDPITSLALKFIVQFEYFDDDKEELKVLQSSWHLDKHDKSKSTNTSHPLYHYEFGGSEITKNAEFNYGDFFLIDSPRIMHPPLDIILAIDFVIKHYYKECDHKTLTQSSLYNRYLKNARLRVWRPYSVLFASNFYDFGDLVVDIRIAEDLIHCQLNDAN